MLASKRNSLKSLLNSKDGVHLTAYVNSQGGTLDMKDQLQLTLDKARECLRSAMDPSELEKFLTPLRGLRFNDSLLDGFSGNLGIFRTPRSFRIINLPVDVESSCSIADTFHVKPLLKWMQFDREFILLGLENGVASLYQGNLDTVEWIDSVFFRKKFANLDHHQDSLSLQDLAGWLEAWISKYSGERLPRLFIAGDPDSAKKLLKKLRNYDDGRIVLYPTFGGTQVSETCQEIRALLKAEARRTFERSLVEFHLASDANFAKSDLFQIAKSAAQGRVKKLLIADDFSLFGILNRTSGDLRIHGRDIDHKDDDILDDLAQLVLSYGGEVIVASRWEVPRGLPILAIIDEELPSFKNMNMEHEFNYLLERSAI